MLKNYLGVYLRLIFKDYLKRYLKICLGMGYLRIIWQNYLIRAYLRSPWKHLKTYLGYGIPKNYLRDYIEPI
jgi:hypothetical protein